MYSRVSESGEKELLQDHLSSVAELCREVCGVISMPCTGKLLAMLHDMGKCSPAWQEYLLSAGKNQVLPHAPAGAKYLKKLVDKLVVEKEAFGEDIRVLRMIQEIICAVIWGHHSGLPDLVSPDSKTYYREHLREELNENELIAAKNFLTKCFNQKNIVELLKASEKELQNIIRRIPCSESESGIDVIAFSLGLIIRFLSSALRDSDCYASAAWSEGIRPCVFHTQPLLWKELLENLEEYIESIPFSEIGEARTSISEECLESVKKIDSHGGVYRLDVVTGGGKTLAVMRSALYLAEKQRLDHIFYVAPFTTILDQTARNLRDVLKRNEVLLEHHCNIFSEDREELDMRENMKERYAERWDIPVVLTSQVQFFNSLFDGRGQCVRRMHQLSNSVLIFDEVQKVPLKCIAMFNVTINFLAKICGCTVILCSATQPVFDKISPPLFLAESPDLVKDVRKHFPIFDRVKLIDKSGEGVMDSDDLTELVRKCLKKIDSVLIILNTKKSVREAYRKLGRELSGEGVGIYHLSTNMCAAHRIEKIDEICKSLEKHERIVCVSTNLVEAGVDFSFDCVIRSYAGLDSVAQAAGRCNRHKEHEYGDVYLIKYTERTGSLVDLEAGQSALREVRSELQLANDSSVDYFAHEVLNSYYRKYFYERKSAMKYSLDNGENLFNYLACNSKAVGECRDDKYTVDLLNQAFQSAGRRFRVIEDETVGVLVPYKRGLELQEILGASFGYYEQSRLYREVQRYTVNIYRNKLTALEEKGVLEYSKENDMYFMNVDFYDDEYGFDEENRYESDDFLF